MSNRDNIKRSVLKGVAFIEQHPAGFFIKGSFPANLLMEKSRLSNIAVKLWTLPHTEKLSESTSFTYALFDEIDALCAAVFCENDEKQYVLCAFFEAAHSDTVWGRMGEIKKILQTYSLKLKGATKNITKTLMSLYGELIKLFSK